jgi:hypothetical protein
MLLVYSTLFLLPCCNAFLYTTAAVECCRAFMQHLCSGTMSYMSCLISSHNWLQRVSISTAAVKCSRALVCYAACLFRHACYMSWSQTHNCLFRHWLFLTTPAACLLCASCTFVLHILTAGTWHFGIYIHCLESFCGLQTIAIFSNHELMLRCHLQSLQLPTYSLLVSSSCCCKATG